MATPGQVRQRRRLRGDSGSSLVEVMVTMFLLAVGMLGVGGMNVTGLKNAMNASLRAQASLSAEDIVERIRANRPNSLDYQISIGSGIPEEGAAIADIDLAEWKTSLADTLPTGDGEVAIDGDRFTVRIEWRERITGSGTTASTFETRQYQISGEL